MNLLFSLFSSYIILIFSVVFHELGHFIFAKIFKFNVVEFSIFIGKQIYKRGIFTLRNKPIGAYVAYEYETEDNTKKYLMQRLIITLGGLLFNLLLIILGKIIGGNIGDDIILINVLMLLLNSLPLGVFNNNKTDALNSINIIRRLCNR